MAFRNHLDEVTKEARISGQWLVVRDQGPQGIPRRNLHFVVRAADEMMTGHWSLTTNL
jgi:hypothetical protein